MSGFFESFFWVIPSFSVVFQWTFFSFFKALCSVGCPPLPSQDFFFQSFPQCPRCSTPTFTSFVLWTGFWIHTNFPESLFLTIFFFGPDNMEYATISTFFPTRTFFLSLLFSFVSPSLVFCEFAVFRLFSGCFLGFFFLGLNRLFALPFFPDPPPCFSSFG